MGSRRGRLSIDRRRRRGGGPDEEANPCDATNTNHSRRRRSDHFHVKKLQSAQAQREVLKKPEGGEEDGEVVGSQLTIG